MKSAQLKELLLQSLEHERGGVLVYEAALECVINADLKTEWKKYLSQTNNHVVVLTNVCESLGLDPKEKTPGTKIVKRNGNALVKAMKIALEKAGKPAAQLVACDCVVLAETKDHANWGLLGACAKALPQKKAAALMAAYDQIEDEEDEHLYHSKGWCRELWFKSLGLTAVLPPPEERKHVKSAIEAAKASQESKSKRKE